MDEFRVTFLDGSAAIAGVGEILDYRRRQLLARVDPLPQLPDPPTDVDPPGGGGTEIFTTGGEQDLQISYYIYDHLGNTRVVYHTAFEECGDDAEYVAEYVADYYPFGKILREWVACDVERYLTTYHERDKESGYDYRGARFYDSDLGRFLSVDPMAASFGVWSPYTYALDNPTKFVDPDGKSPKPVGISKREQRRQNRAERKWDRKIRREIYRSYQEGIDSRAIVPGDRASAEAYLQNTADALTQKYGRRRWFGYYSQNSNRTGMATSTTAQRGKHKVSNKSRHNVTIQLFSTAGSPFKFGAANNPVQKGVMQLQNGQTATVSAPSDLNSQQASSGGFLFNFDALANADNLNITGSSGNTLINQTNGALTSNGSTASGVFPFSEAGTSVNVSVTNAAGGTASTNMTFWDLSVDYFYLNPQPRIYSGYHQ